MRFLITLLILFTTSTALANGTTALYFLTGSDLKALSGGFQYALNHGQNYQAVEWQNPRTGLSGTMIPTKTYQTTFGQVCREYTASVQLDGSIQQAVGMACLRKDGSWQVTGEKPINRQGEHVRFVYVASQLKENHQQVQNRGHTSAGQKNLECPLDKNGNYHSKDFHEKLRNYRKFHQTSPEKPDVKERQPSKLIKLVAY